MGTEAAARLTCFAEYDSAARELVAELKKGVNANSEIVATALGKIGDKPLSRAHALNLLAESLADPDRLVEALVKSWAFLKPDMQTKQIVIHLCERLVEEKHRARILEAWSWHWGDAALAFRHWSVHGGSELPLLRIEAGEGVVVGQDANGHLILTITGRGADADLGNGRRKGDNAKEK